MWWRCDEVWWSIRWSMMKYSMKSKKSCEKIIKHVTNIVSWFANIFVEMNNPHHEVCRWRFYRRVCWSVCHMLCKSLLKYLLECLWWIIYHSICCEECCEECFVRVRWMFVEDMMKMYFSLFVEVCCWSMLLKYVVEVDKDFVIMLWKYVMNNLH